MAILTCSATNYETHINNKEVSVMQFKSEQEWEKVEKQGGLCVSFWEVPKQKENIVQSKTTILDPVQEEWTKYFVNGYECDKEDIYQTILDNTLYNGPVTLDKKYHFNRCEESITEERGFFSHTSRHVSKQNESNNKSANFSLDTKKFTEKFTPTSCEYKLLISNMVYTLDMFYEAGKNYKEHANNFQFALRHCLSYFFKMQTSLMHLMTSS
jgi:hypothetical protein